MYLSQIEKPLLVHFVLSSVVKFVGCATEAISQAGVSVAASARDVPPSVRLRVATATQKTV